MSMEKLYLSKRDIGNLLGKLDSVRNGEVSTCTIIKNDTAHPVYPQTLRRIAVVAFETEDRHMPGVSPRVHLSRASLTSLLEAIESQSGRTIQFDELEVFAISDDKYYVNRSATDTAPIGDLAAGFFRNRGKQS
jgi:hypothetical protein